MKIPHCTAENFNVLRKGPWSSLDIGGLPVKGNYGWKMELPVKGSPKKLFLTFCLIFEYVASLDP